MNFVPSAAAMMVQSVNNPCSNKLPRSSIPLHSGTSNSSKIEDRISNLISVLLIKIYSYRWFAKNSNFENNCELIALHQSIANIKKFIAAD